MREMSVISVSVLSNTCLRCEVQFHATLHLCAFAGLLPPCFQTCFCMKKKRTALDADQSKVTKSAKKLRWVAEPSDKKWNLRWVVKGV